MTYRYTCTRCGGQGHKRTTCSKSKAPPAPAKPRGIEDMTTQEIARARVLFVRLIEDIDARLRELADAPNPDAPYVCHGCHAVGEERCAPGCIDAEIEREREDEQLYGPRDEEEDEASE